MLIISIAVSCIATVAVDCEVGPWREWGECDVRCGPGVRQRTRPVTVAPLNGGQACPPTVEKTACDGARCKYPRAPRAFDELRGIIDVLLHVLVFVLGFLSFFSFRSGTFRTTSKHDDFELSLLLLSSTLTLWRCAAKLYHLL